MNILFYFMIIVAAVAVVTTVYAFAAAKDGYQDESGFHPGLEPGSAGVSTPRFLRPPTTTESSHLPPMLVPH